MDFSYFQKINNLNNSSSKWETERFLVNQHEERWLYDNIDRELVLKNGEEFEMLIIKGTADNNKKIKSKNSRPFNLGDYIDWNGKIWIVTSIDSDDKVHHSGSMHLCTHVLRWQNTNGEIIERWAYAEDFTKYDAGTVANGVISIASNQYGMTVPIDQDTKILKRGTRFVVDFDDAEEPDVYKLTNRKTALTNDIYFGRGGILVLTLTFDSFDKDKDRKITMPDGKEVWICGYNSADESTQIEDVNIRIVGEDEIVGGRKRAWNVEFTDGSGNTVDPSNVRINWSWDILDTYYSVAKDVQILNTDNYSITLKCSKEYIGESFSLGIRINGKIVKDKTIEIIGM